MRVATCRGSRSRAKARRCWWKCRPMPSCTTWCATSSAACCWSAGASARKLDRRSAGGPRPHASPDPPRQRRAWFSWGRCILRAWELPAGGHPVSRTLSVPASSSAASPAPATCAWPCELGVDCIGFVFAPRQYAQAGAGARRAHARGAGAPLVDRGRALFMDNSRRKTAKPSPNVRPDLLQFHGERRRCVLPSVRPAVPQGDAMGGRRQTRHTAASAFPGA